MNTPLRLTINDYLHVDSPPVIWNGWLLRQEHDESKGLLCQSTSRALWFDRMDGLIATSEWWMQPKPKSQFGWHSAILDPLLLRFFVFELKDWWDGRIIVLNANDGRILHDTRIDQFFIWYSHFHCTIYICGQGFFISYQTETHDWLTFSPGLDWVADGTLEKADSYPQSIEITDDVLIFQWPTREEDVSHGDLFPESKTGQSDSGLL